MAKRSHAIAPPMRRPAKRAMIGTCAHEERHTMSTDVAKMIDAGYRLGYWRERSKLDEFCWYHPTKREVLLVKEEFDAIRRQSGMTPVWLDRVQIQREAANLD